MAEIVKIFDYVNESGELQYQNVRYEPKDFRQRRPGSSSRHIWNLDGVQRVPYRLPELLKSSKQDFVYITEGEADADRLCELGLPATTSGNATSWKPEFSKYFKGRLVCVIPDNDASGDRYAKDILNSLYRVAAEVRVLRLPNLKKSEDVSDWLNNGGTTEQLLELVDKTEPSKSEPDVKLNLMVLSNVKAKNIEWFWPDKIPAGAISMFVGDCGSAKTYLSMYLSALISTGGVWPSGQRVKKGSVIILNDEDPAERLRERLAYHNADMSKIHIVKSVNEDKEYFPASIGAVIWARTLPIRERWRRRWRQRCWVCPRSPSAR
jgi:5S rRNA maturation endonuclease (ribonuclease M5)